MKLDLKTNQKQIEQRADSAADNAEKAVRTLWSQLLSLMESNRSINTYQYVSRCFDWFHQTLRLETSQFLVDTARWQHEQTLAIATKHIPQAKRNLTEDWFDDLVAEYIFPTPSAQEIYQLVFNSNWVARMNSLTQLASPNVVAAAINNGIAQGLAPAALARQIRPIVQNVQTSARRIARTEAVRVAHEQNLQTWEQLGEMVHAYRIHCVHGNPNSREWHVQRDGTIYYRNPQPGQKGFQQMPRPPFEAEDPAERPPNTPQLAHNCLCWLEPLIRGIGDAESKSEASI